MHFLSVATLLLFSLPSESLSEEINTTCRIPPVEVGGKTTLTCYFSANVGQLKQDIQIVHNSNNAETNPILTCLWDIESLDCITDQLFKFNNTFDDTLHLEIPAATEYLSGNYSCVVLGHKQGHFEMCFLMLHEGSTASHRDQSTSESSVTAVPSKACTVRYVSATFHNAVTMVLLWIGIPR